MTGTPATRQAHSRMGPSAPSTRSCHFPFEPGADDRDRTGDLVLTKDVLCQLSYIGLRRVAASADPSACLWCLAAPACPSRLTSTPIPSGLPDEAVSGANKGRSLERETGIEPATNSLEGCDSTTELLPP